MSEYKLTKCGLQNEDYYGLAGSSFSDSDLTDTEESLCEAISEGIDFRDDYLEVYEAIYEWAKKVVNGPEKNGTYYHELTHEKKYCSETLAKIQFVEIMLLGLWGDYGTSPRFGWFYEKHIEKFKKMVDTILFPYYMEFIIPDDDRDVEIGGAVHEAELQGKGEK